MPGRNFLEDAERPTVAIFSSFRKFLGEVAAVRTTFIDHGIDVSTPPSVEPIKSGVEYVRFPTDNPDLADHEIQELVMARALASTAIYVVCPSGYTGTLTSYEIGRAVQAERPLYFSEMPRESYLLGTALDRIVEPIQLVDIVSQGLAIPLRPTSINRLF